MSLTLDVALDLINAAIQAGRERGIPLAAAVLDIGGHVVASARSEQSGFINLEAAQRKATTSVSFRAPTHALLQMIKDDAVLLQSVIADSRLSVLPGGVPIMVDGALVGALGVAGGHYQQDQAAAEAALGALH